MNRIEEFKKVKQIIKNLYPQASLGIFNTRNWCGDLTINIFSGEHFKVDICYQYEYFEVFGTTDEEWTELERLYEELTNDISIAYMKEEDCKAEYVRVIRQIEMEQRREKDEVMSSLSILRMTVNRIDSRQLRIWRQLGKLLKVQVEEVK